MGQLEMFSPLMAGSMLSLGQPLWILNVSLNTNSGKMSEKVEWSPFAARAINRM